MSQVLAFSASLLMYLLYVLTTLGVAVAIMLAVDKLLAKQEDKVATR
jgi:hypothetical protein